MRNSYTASVLAPHKLMSWFATSSGLLLRTRADRSPTRLRTSRLSHLCMSLCGDAPLRVTNEHHHVHRVEKQGRHDILILKALRLVENGKVCAMPSSKARVWAAGILIEAPVMTLSS